MAWCQVTNGRVSRTLNRPKGISINNIQYPASIFHSWSNEQLAELGLFPLVIVHPVDFDSRYHRLGSVTRVISLTAVTDTYDKVDKDVDDLKEIMESKINSLSSDKLTVTDWMAIRAYEGGTAIPAEISTYRTTVRSVSNAKSVEIAALTSIDEIKAYENFPVTVTDLVTHVSEDEVPVTTYGPETIVTDTFASKVSDYGWPVDPLAEVDPKFVSRVDTA
jgi:hypothetical protein